MGLLNKIARFGQKIWGSSPADPNVTTHGLRICRYEEMESRALMAGDLHVGAVYFEDASGDDASPDIIQISFEGGAPGTQMTRVVIDGQKNAEGRSAGDVFFDIAPGGLGAFGSSGLKIVSNNGFTIVNTTVTDGGSKLIFDLAGFDAGEKLVLSVDADEIQFLHGTDIDVNAFVEGGEFQRSHLTASFTAPHFYDVTGSAVFFDAYDHTFEALDAQAGNHLNLPPDIYDPPTDYTDRTAGAAVVLDQIPLPITLSGNVFEDLNSNNHQDPGDNGIVGVTLELLKFNGTTYVSTGKTTTTDGVGHYKFDDILPGKYRVVETQPIGYFSVGAQAGTVGGVVDGVVTTSDIISEITLLGGDDSVHNDFAEAKPASIAGHVHVDLDGDCIQDPGEPNLAGVKMYLLNSAGVVIASTVTDANGDYIFENLAPGTYGVKEEQPVGYFDSGEMPGSAGGVVSSNDVITGAVLGSGVHAVNYDFCEMLPASISGHVHADLDGDCMQDPGEPELAGVKIFLLDEAGRVVGTTLTDIHGDYKFEGLAPGTYGVREEQPAGYFDGMEQAGSAGGAVTANDLITGAVLGSGVNAVGYDFCELLPASISGHIHVDLDGDCMQDPGEPALEGVRVFLLDANGNVIDETLTDANGDYIFDGLAPGTYGVREEQPAGYFDSGEMAGSAGGVVSANDVITGVVLGSGVNAIDYDFCEMLPASISGHVHADIDGDCMQDPGEPELAGVKMFLLNAQGQVVATTLTDEHGNYKFDNLAPGTYGVREEQPTGYFDGSEMAGSAGGAVTANDVITGAVLGSGVQAVDYNFCELLPATIAGHVHVDLDGDCMQDAGEPVLAGVKIFLLDSSGTVIGQTLTDANGDYKFEGLAPGTYGVREEQPVGYFDGEEMAGSAGGAVTANDLITGAVLTSGLNAVEYNFCELAPTSISGHVHADMDGNCMQDPGEPAIAGVKIFLLDSNGNVIGQTLTDVNGNYKFDQLAPGTYGVREEQPAGYFDSGEMAGSAGGVVSANDVITGAVLTSGMNAVEYNFCELLPASIRGHVFVDLDDDCIVDPGEQAIAGVVVHLLDNTGAVIATTLTDANGDYQFNDLEPGTYSVREEQPNGYFNGGQMAGSAGGSIEIEDTILDAILGPGVNAVEYNFCEILPGSISGYVFRDGGPITAPPGSIPEVQKFKDGKLTPDDVRLAGVILELRDGVTGQPILGSRALNGTYSAASPIRTTTDANGYYQFTGLPAGNYAVFEIQPDGFIDSIDTEGSTGGITFNPGETVPETVLLALGDSPVNGDAIVRITLFAGQNSVENNFSEVIIDQPFFFQPQPVAPPTPFNPPTALIITPPVNPFVPASLPIQFVQPYYSGSSIVNYTWHLSVIDAGQPRGPGGEDAVVKLTTTRLDSMGWHQMDMSQSEWQLAPNPNDGRAGAPKSVMFGLKGAIPVTGDFNGDGVTDIGVYKDGEWFIDLNGNGVWDAGDLWAKLGHADDKPVTGDWDGDGKTDIGIYGPAWPGDPRAIKHEPGLPDPDNTHTNVTKNVPRPLHKTAIGVRSMKRTSEGKIRADLIDHVFHYGTPKDVPLVGDWNGDGIDTIAVFHDGTWYFDVDGDGKWSDGDYSSKYGQAGDIPVVGDFNGDGVPEIGVYRGGTWYIDTNGNHQIDPEDQVIHLGGPGDKPVVGDWDGDGRVEPGVYHDGEIVTQSGAAAAE